VIISAIELLTVFEARIKFIHGYNLNLCGVQLRVMLLFDLDLISCNTPDYFFDMFKAVSVELRTSFEEEDNGGVL